MFITEAFANTSLNPATTIITNLMPLLIFVVIFYLFLIKPQQKKSQEQSKMIKNLKAGDKVLTSGGIIATVKKNKDKEFVLEISKDVKIKVLPEAIKSLIKN